MPLHLFIGDKHFSSWSMRASLLLREKGLDYNEHQIELDWPVEFTDGGIRAWDETTLETFAPEPATGCRCLLSHLSHDDPTGLIRDSYATSIPRVPILVDDESEAVVADVIAIGEYLEEKFPEPALIDGDDAIRAAVRTVAANIQGEFLRLHEGMSYAMSYRPNDQGNPPASALDQASRLVKLLDSSLHYSARKNRPGGFLFGQLSIADVMFAPLAQSFRGWKYSLDQWPKVEEYVDRVLSRSTVASYLDEARLPYNLLQSADSGSLTWIARHYRYRPDLSLIHNWQSDITHRLYGDVAKIAFEIAYQGGSIEDIVAKLEREYQPEQFDVHRSQIEEDITSFFAAISPKRDKELSAVPFEY